MTRRPTEISTTPGTTSRKALAREDKNDPLEALGRFELRTRDDSSVGLSEDMESKNKRSQLQKDLHMSKQYLRVYKIASEVSVQKIHRVGEAVVEGESDQIVVTTSADLFDVKKALCKNRSAQLFATLTPENFHHVVKKRYSNRFSALPDRSICSQPTPSKG